LGAIRLVRLERLREAHDETGNMKKKNRTTEDNGETISAQESQEGRPVYTYGNYLTLASSMVWKEETTRPCLPT